jgi:CRP-like cAMP-binding protein
MEGLCNLLEADSGELILNEEQPPSDFYVICSGEVRSRYIHIHIQFKPVLYVYSCMCWLCIHTRQICVELYDKPEADARERILDEGQPPSDFYVICSGEVSS